MASDEWIARTRLAMQFDVAFEARAVLEARHGFGDFYQIIGGFYGDCKWRLRNHAVILHVQQYLSEWIS